MAFDPLTAILNVGNTVLDRVLPDKAAKDAAQAQLLQMQLTGELDQIRGQLAINQAEAGSPSVFVAGWRPWIGWVCGSAFAYTYILHPIVLTILVAFHVEFDAAKLPTLNMSEMMPVLLGMLGLGGMRTYEKVQGVSTGH